MLNYEQSCGEWVKGCSNTIGGHAEDCEECTRIFREHIKRLVEEDEKKERLYPMPGITPVWRAKCAGLMRLRDGLSGTDMQKGADSMTETVLFVGGSADGERLNISSAAKEIRLLVPPTQSDSLMCQRLIEESYRRIVPHTLIHDRPCPIYLISTESPDNLIPLLIEGYRRKE